MIFVFLVMLTRKAGYKEIADFMLQKITTTIKLKKYKKITF